MANTTVHLSYGRRRMGTLISEHKTLEANPHSCEVASRDRVFLWIESIFLGPLCLVISLSCSFCSLCKPLTWQCISPRGRRLQQTVHGCCAPHNQHNPHFIISFKKMFKRLVLPLMSPVYSAWHIMLVVMAIPVPVPVPMPESVFDLFRYKRNFV